MRQADDLADDESMPRDERRHSLEAWLAEWRAVCTSGSTTDPVFLAVRDCTARFHIPLSLLDELVAGVTMDLDRAIVDPARNKEAGCPILSASSAERVGNHTPDTYATFADLYRYCYLVASVVGLVCIRIFGYADPRAEKLAEETGIAFQLTNILRDVAEDAARNRVYLPLEDLAAHGVSLDSLLHRAPGAPPTANERALLVSIAQRAEKYYQSAQELLPLIDRESRPALWVLVAIYHGLLKRIERAEYDVFSQCAIVPMPRKLFIMAIGVARMGWARLFA
jgi:phytoene synthase